MNELSVFANDMARIFAVFSAINAQGRKGNRLNKNQVDALIATFLSEASMFTIEFIKRHQHEVKHKHDELAATAFNLIAMCLEEKR